MYPNSNSKKKKSKKLLQHIQLLANGFKGFIFVCRDCGQRLLSLKFHETVLHIYEKFKYIYPLLHVLFLTMCVCVCVWYSCTTPSEF